MGDGRHNSTQLLTFINYLEITNDIDFLQFLDLEGKVLPNQTQFIHKNNKVYCLDKQSKETTLSQEVKKIGNKLQKNQNKDDFAGIKKPKAGAKLTNVGIPKVPTRSK